MSAGDVLGFDNVINSPVTTMLLIFDTLDFLNHRSHLVLQLSIIYGIKFRIGCRCLLVQVSPPRLPHTNLCWCGAGGFPESEQAADPYLQPQRLFILFAFLHTSYQDSLSSNSRSAFYHLSLGSSRPGLCVVPTCWCYTIALAECGIMPFSTVLGVPNRDDVAICEKGR
jgi:hypothetical protein